MKQLFVVLMIVGSLLYLKLNPIMERTDIYTKDHERIGYIEYNPIMERFDVKTIDGEDAGYYEENPLTEEFEYYEEDFE